MKSLNKAFMFLKGFILFNIIWYIGSIIVNSRALPTPIAVYAHLPNIFANKFYYHITASLERVLIGLFISIILGATIGLIMGYSKKLNDILNPLVYFTYPIPKTALLPVVMILFGLGDNSKITLIVIITIFQFIVSVRDAVKNVTLDTYHPLISLGASRLQLFNHVTLPAILPELLTNIRLSIGTALSILFFAEAYGTRFGLGYFIQDAWTRIDYLSMYGGILVLGLLGFLLFIMIDFIEEIVCNWKNTK